MGTRLLAEIAYRTALQALRTAIREEIRARKTKSPVHAEWLDVTRILRREVRLAAVYLRALNAKGV